MYEKWWLAQKDEEVSREGFPNLDSKQGTLSRVFTEIYSRKYCIHEEATTICSLSNI